MAKAAKTSTTEPTEEGARIPAPLAVALEENDSVLQAHYTRQANHFTDLAPALAKKAREDEEREARLQEIEIIAERNRKERERQQKEQAEREERETAAEKAKALRAEIAELEAAIKDKTAEASRLEKLVKEG